MTAAADDLRVADKKRLALALLSEAWNEAIAEGVDPEILAHTALFQALSDLVETYGEEAVASLAGGLPGRIRQFEFSIRQPVQ